MVEEEEEAVADWADRFLACLVSPACRLLILAMRTAICAD